MALKGFIIAAVVFLVFSLLPYEAATQSDGPKATDKVFFTFKMSWLLSSILFKTLSTEISDLFQLSRIWLTLANKGDFNHSVGFS